MLRVSKKDNAVGRHFILLYFDRQYFMLWRLLIHVSIIKDSGMSQLYNNLSAYFYRLWHNETINLLSLSEMIVISIPARWRMALGETLIVLVKK